MLKAKYPHLIGFGCLAHGLTLLTKDLVSGKTMKTVLAHCKAMVNVFNNHHAASKSWKKLQKEKQGKN